MHRGEWIKGKIKDRGYTLDILAEQLEMARTTLWRITTSENVPLFKLKILADAIGVDLRTTFPEAASLYEKKEKDYRLLYHNSLEEIQELREQVEKYKEITESYRDRNGTENE